MSVYPEKRDGRLTGYWYAEVRSKRANQPRFRRRFETRKEAEGYEAYVRATDQEPPGIGGEVSGLTFAAVCAEYEDKGPWRTGRDISVISRADTLCNLSFGRLPIEHIDYAKLEALVEDLTRRPGPKGKVRKPATVNRYLTAASEVLRYAVRKKYRPDMPELPWRIEPKQPRIHWLTEAAGDALVSFQIGELDSHQFL
jgi:hypothetical protein